MHDNTLVARQSKKQISNSVIYYRGITNIVKKSSKDKKVPADYYKAQVNSIFIDDLIQQIFILAQYSEYKRKKLELATKLMVATIISGVLVVSCFCILSYINGLHIPIPLQS